MSSRFWSTDFPSQIFITWLKTLPRRDLVHFQTLRIRDFSPFEQWKMDKNRVFEDIGITWLINYSNMRFWSIFHCSDGLKSHIRKVWASEPKSLITSFFSGPKSLPSSYMWSQNLVKHFNIARNISDKIYN